MKLRILVVDDQKTIRENIKAFLSKVTDLELVGTAVDGYEAIAKVKELKPDIILMDIEMPGLEASFKNGVFWVTNAGENEPSFDFAYRTRVLL